MIRRSQSTQEPTAIEPVKVLHVLSRMGLGGAELRTMRVFRQVDRRRFHFHFCSVSGRPGPLDDEIRALGGQVHLIHRGRASFARRFRNLLLREQFDVVHANLHHISGYLLRLAAQCGVAVRVAQFVNSQAAPVNGWGRRMFRKLMSVWDPRYAGPSVMRGWIDRYATDILGLSQWSLTGGWKANWQSDPRCRVVYDGLDPREFARPRESEAVRRELGVAGDGPLYIHVGRMAPQKNHVRLVDIFSEVLRRRPAARLLLVGRMTSGMGDRTEAQRVRQRIAQRGIAERVVFAGERTDVARLLKAADALIFPSLWEGLGDVVFESCAAGTPVLCSDLPCIREIACRLPGVRYLSLEEPDAVWARQADEMAAAAMTDAMRQASLEAVTQSVFNIETCAAGYCRIWRNSVARSRPGGVVRG